ncbi:putative quinol monooxygenase [Clostridium sp.]|uniref:putative quinol monooxygenase n=1 Tax=Clostridium sp. TaxID=1506 RepID=UPI003217035F
MIIIVAKNVVKKEEVENFKDLAKKLIVESRKEDGCIEYGLYEDIKQGNILTFIEKWESQDAIKIHNNTKHFTTIVPQFRELQEKDSEVTLYSGI